MNFMKMNFDIKKKKINPLKTDYFFSEFYFQYRNSFRAGTYSYKIKKEEDNYLLEYDSVDCKYGILTGTVDRETVLSLIHIMKELEIGKWNGFSGSNHDIRDGYSFTFNAHFIDCGYFSCSGENSFPDNFSDFRKKIQELFEPYINNLFEIKRKQFFEQNIFYDVKSLMCNLIQGNGYNSDSYYFRLSKREEKSQLCIRIETDSDRYVEHGKYYLDTEIINEMIPYDRINKLIEKCDVKYWDSANGNIDNNPDWYQIDFHFADDKIVSCIGSEKLNNYEFFRDEIIDIAVKLYNDIKEK